MPCLLAVAWEESAEQKGKDEWLTFCTEMMVCPSCLSTFTPHVGFANTDRFQSLGRTPA